MRREDLVLLDFARMWSPFGGPSDGDILVNFGMSRVKYCQRVQEILEVNTIEGYTADTLRSQLGMIDPAPPPSRA